MIFPFFGQLGGSIYSSLQVEDVHLEKNIKMLLLPFYLESVSPVGKQENLV